MSTKATRKFIAERLAAAGLEPHAVAGIMGNLAHESGMIPTTENSIGAYGIAQWLGSRRRDLNQFATKAGKSPSNLGVQVDFLISEIKSGRQGVTIGSLNKSSGPQQASNLFFDKFERAGDSTGPTRAANAAKLLSLAKRVSSGKTRSTTSGKTYQWVPNETDSGYNPFGKPNSRYQAGKHTGYDISANRGASIVWAPPVDGKVISVNSSGSDYGQHMIIRDTKGREWLFAHMESKPLKVGTRVSQGMKIGEVGSSGTSTGPHLHIEQTRQGPGGWDYNSPNLKAPKLKFKSKKDYNPSGDPNDDMEPGDYGMSSQTDPEVQALIRKAARNDWSPDRFQWKLRETQWYQSRSEAQRKFDMLTEVDKQAQLKAAQARVKQMAGQFGVPLTKQQIEREATRLARDGESEEQTRAWFARKYVYDPEKGQSGLAATFQESLMETAAEYGLKLTDKELRQWTRKAIRDGADPQEFDDDMRARAQSLYPHVDLSTRTLRMALSPYLQQAADELDINPNTVDLTDPMWSEVFDPATGNLLTPQQWREKMVSDKRYRWESSRKGKEGAAALAASLGRIFGGLS